MKEEFGPYRIVRKIAVGGMAEIYLARQRGIEGLERTVVLKKILEKHAQNEEFITMFLDEARLMAALSHPNIAQVLDLGREGSAYYLVVEYVRGPTLFQLLTAAQKAGRGRLPDKPALGIALAIAEALHYVHECRDELGRSLGIVHRDLHPANVVVSYDGAVKLIDFGIAKAATKVYETRTGVIKGTYGYIAPETLTCSAPVDRRADVFALGILLYEMLVGRHPFDVSNELNLLDRIIEARYKRPKEVRPELPAALDALIVRCLAPHPEGRPESVQRLMYELTAHMAERGIVPMQIDCAKLARELVPDDEGPVRVRRPTSIKPPSVLASDAPKVDSTRPLSLASGPPERTGPTRRVGPEGTPSALRVVPPAAPSEEHQPATRQSAVPRLLGAAFILATGFLAFLATRSLVHPDEDVVRAGPTAPSIEQGPTESAADAGPELVRTIRIVSEPPGASITVEGGLLATVTPTTITVDSQHASVHVIVSRDGYITESRRVPRELEEARFVLQAAESPTPRIEDAGLALPDAGVSSPESISPPARRFIRRRARRAHR